MKKRRLLFMTLGLILLLIGIPVGFLLSTYRQDQANRDLMAAIRRGDEKAALAALQAGADPNTYPPYTRPLSFRQTVQRLLDSFRHPNTPIAASDRATPLLLIYQLSWVPDAHNMPVMVIPGEHPHLVQALLERGADPNARGIDALSPLMWASLAGYTDSAQLLIQRGADVNARTDSGETSVILAAKFGHAKTLRLLLTNHADAGAKEANGNDALFYARKNHDRACTELLNRNPSRE